MQGVPSVEGTLFSFWRKKPLQIYMGGKSMKKFLILLLSAVLALSCAVGFSACNILPPDDETGGPVQPVDPDGPGNTGDPDGPDDPGAPHEHTFGEWIVTVPATCTEEGEEQRTCACGETETRTVAALGHNYVDGVCTRCGESLVETDESYFQLNQWGYMDASFCIAWNETKKLPSKVVIPKEFSNCPVMVIGDFANSDTLSEIVIPNSVVAVDDDAFENCINLQNISLGKGITSIGSGAFRGCTSLEKIILPEGITSIGEEAFFGCTNLKEIVIPSGVRSIAPDTFSGCTSLRKITIPDSVTSIASEAFSNCNQLFEEEGGIYYVDKWVIDCDRGITNVTLRSDTVGIAEEAFRWCDLDSIAIPDNVKAIGEEAFFGCSQLIEEENGVEYVDNWVIDCNTDTTSVILRPDTVGIADHAFADCRDLMTIDLPDCVSAIGNSAFYQCDSLTSITIPDDVTSIGDSAFYRCDSLASVTIGNGVTVIGSGAFYYCTNLTSITIPDSVTSIGSSAFYNCTGLTSVTIGNGVTSIGGSAFYNCNQTKFSIPGDVTSVGRQAFYNSGLESISIAEGTSYIEWAAFAGCSGLTSITIPDSVTTIFSFAFSCGNMTSTTSLTIGSGLTSIGYQALNFVNLMDITVSAENPVYHSVGNCLIETESKTLILGSNTSVIPDDGSVSSIGYAAFTYCDSLTSITIPDSVKSIGEYAFSGCESLTSVTIGNGVTSIGDEAFWGCESLTSMTIGDGVTSIGRDTFYGCDGILEEENGVYYVDRWAVNCDENITNVSLRSDTVGIADYAFSSCDSLTSITIPDSVTSIGDGAFRYCNSLTSIIVSEGNPVYHSAGNCLIETESKTLVVGCKNSVIPNDGSVTSIGEEAFQECYRLTSITIPDSVTSIGYRAFYDCESLTSITIPDSVTSIGSDAFRYCDSLTSIAIPDSVTSIGDSAFDGCTSLTSITIPDSVTSIGREAFYYCESLTSIIIGNGVTSIGDGAFRYCNSLTSITVSEGNPVYHSAGNCLIETESKTLIVGCKNSIIPDDDSVTSIGEEAFYDCTNLTSIAIPDNITSIGREAFAWCDSLTSVTIGSGVTSIGSSAFYNCDSLTSVTIGNGVTSIGSSAFYGCESLTSITIPDSVTSIGGKAFYWCTGLTSVTIGDSVTSIGVYAFAWCDSLTSVVFENPNGWSAGATLSATSLSNTATAAWYLCDTYLDYNWTRK